MTLQEEELSKPRPADSAPSIYRAGTLVYTSRGLVVLFFWMLFGDFCFTMMEAIVPTMVPLLLKELPISNTMIALVIGTIPNLIGMVVTPIIAYRSDRHRGPKGRRIPFLIMYSPIVAVTVALTGFSKDIATWFHQIISARFESIASWQVMFVTIAACSILFQFFNVFVSSIYYYLFNDVIPPGLLGRYYALFRIVGAVSGIVFNRYVLGWTEHHMRIVFVVIALVYLIAFMLMCANVREGEYPPPDERKPETGRVRRWVSGIKSFVRECYSQPFYWPLYVGYSFLLVGGSGIGLFRLIFATKELRMPLEEFGRVMSWGLVISLLMYYPLGWLADRLHPMRLMLFGIAATLAVCIGSAVGINSTEGFVLWTLMGFVSQAICVSANAPLYPRILPKSHFGQFSAAISLLSSGAVVIGNLVVGKLVDEAQTYLIIYWWSVWFTAVSFACYLVFYVMWNRRRGAAKFRDAG